jgi:hypothetical protein
MNQVYYWDAVNFSEEFIEDRKLKRALKSIAAPSDLLKPTYSTF